MTVKDMKDELEFYEDDAEIIFEVDDDLEVDSATFDRYGFTTVRVNEKLKPDFICDLHGDMNIQLGVIKE